MSDSSQDIDCRSKWSDIGIYLCINVLKKRHFHILFAYQVTLHWHILMQIFHTSHIFDSSKNRPNPAARLYIQVYRKWPPTGYSFDPFPVAGTVIKKRCIQICQHFNKKIDTRTQQNFMYAIPIFGNIFTLGMCRNM